MKKVVAVLATVFVLGVMALAIFDPATHCSDCGAIMDEGKIVWYREPAGSGVQEMHCPKCEQVELVQVDR